MSLFQNVRQLFRGFEEPRRALRFWRHAGLLSVRLCDQQRPTLDSNSKGSWPAESEAFRWRFNRRRHGCESPQIDFARPIAVEGVQTRYHPSAGPRTIAAVITKCFECSIPPLPSGI